MNGHILEENTGGDMVGGAGNVSSGHTSAGMTAGTGTVAGSSQSGRASVSNGIGVTGGGTSGGSLVKGSGSTNSSSLNGEEDSICRDFLRNVCRRGSKCKFRHPDSLEASGNLSQNTTELIFCHDYQNDHCSRPMCRFIHCTRDEEDCYVRTSQILPHILDQAIRKGQVVDATLNGDKPICKDFLYGECSRRRGGKCKFRHLTPSEYDKEIYGSCRSNLEYSSSQNFDGAGPTNSIQPDPKRQRFDSKLPASVDFRGGREFAPPLDDIGRDAVGRGIAIREFLEWDRECDCEQDRRGLEDILLPRKQLEAMKKEISSLKKENSDLRATRDFLLEKLGLSKAVGNVTTVTVPTVTLGNTIPVVSSVQPLANSIPVVSSVQPLTAAQVTHPLSISSDGAVGSVVTIQPPQAPPRQPPPPQAPPQPMAPPAQQVGVAPPQPTVVGSVGGVQVSLSQAVAPALTAVSLSTVTLNPPIVPVTSMARSIAAPSVAQSIAAPPTAQSIAAPPTAQSMAQAMSMSGTTGHLVSYPIMTQPVLRPQLQ